MGAKCYACQKGEALESPHEYISKTNFTKLHLIGKGGYGRVRI